MAPPTVTRRQLLLVPAAVVLAPAVETAPAAAGRRLATGTWATALTGPPTAPVPETVFEDRTLRQIVHTSVAGHAPRVTFSNLYGREPLVIAEARLARHAGDSRIDPATDRRLTFAGRASVTIAPGRTAQSDPVPLPVPAASDWAISAYLPARTVASTLHSSAFRTNYHTPGNRTRAAALPTAAATTSWYFLAGLDVTVPGHAGAIVAFGDSITDGASTTTDANHRWPDELAARLRATPALRGLGVLNKGIGGNRLLHDGNTLPVDGFAGLGPLFGEAALRRYDRDVLRAPGARHVIVLLGINDIGQPGSTSPASEAVTVAQLIAAHRELIGRAHARGLRIHGGTLTPFRDTTIPGYYTPEREAQRQALNHWIRTSGAYDAVLDFDRAVRDPAAPARMLPAYDSGDHLHPNDAGMRAMAAAIPLRLFTPHP